MNQKTLVILGHPNLKERSIANAIIVNHLEKQENTSIRHLAELYPDYRIDVEAEQQALLKADAIILQFPFYWYSVPAILKLWMDEVLAYGFAYGSTGTKLKGKKLILSITIGGPEDAYQRSGYNTYTIEELLYPLQQTANLTGMSFEDPVITHSMIYIPGVYNTKGEVEARAHDHGQRLIKALKADG